MLLKADSLSLTIALFIFVDIWVRVRTSRILCVLHSCLLLFIQKNCGATNKNCHHSRLCSWMPTCVSFLKALNGNEWFVMVGVVAAMVCPLPTPFRYDQLICHFSVSSWIAQHFKCPLWLKLEWTRDFCLILFKFYRKGATTLTSLINWHKYSVLFLWKVPICRWISWCATSSR